jgi:hypothetical protein
MHRLPAAILAIAGLFAPPQDRARDQVTVGTSVVLGTVTDARTGLPVSGAIVTIAGTTRPPDTEVRSDGEGQFIIDHVAAGRYSIAVKRSGYFDAEFGQRQPLGVGETFTLNDGERRAGVDISMVKPAALLGTVLDDAGQPVVKLDVHAYRRSYAGGRPRYTAVGIDATDDRGVFRIGHLPAGDYIIGVPVTRPRGIDDGDRSADMPRDGGAVSALPQISGRSQVYAPAFFPSGVAPASATVVTVDFGEVRRNVDFQVRPAPALRVAGIVTKRPGSKGNPRIRLAPVGGPLFEEGEIADVSASESGAFAINAVPPGQYRLQASLNGGWADEPLSLSDSDVEDVRMLMRDPLRVSGRIAFEGTQTDPGRAADAELAVRVDRADGLRIEQPPAFTLDATGRNFTLAGLPPGRYLLAVDRAPAGWSLKSTSYQGRDVSQSAFDLTTGDAGGIVITLTDRSAIVSGRVSGAGADADIAVFVFPRDPQRWVDFGPSGSGFRAIQTRAGRFDIRDLPPGDYIAIAAETDVALAWKTPDFLQAAARNGTPFQLSDGATYQLDLTVSAIK